MRIGRYCIIPYNEQLVTHLIKLARHVYAVVPFKGSKGLCEFAHNAVPEEVLITDKMIPITSSHDVMSWELFLQLNYIKDRSILRG